MNPEKRQLIHDLLDTEGRREATLRAGGQILRRRRYWRAARRSFAVVALAIAAVVVVEQRSELPQKSAPVSTAESRPAPVQVKTLTDDELLALFPKTPVALATLSNGRKTLFFLHPGDEQRFVTHL